MVVMGGDSRSKGCGFKSQTCSRHEKTKINKKRIWWLAIFKIKSTFVAAKLGVEKFYCFDS